MKRLGALALLVAVGAWAAAWGGRWLVRDDGPAAADVAVVLSGDAARRGLHARDLVRAGRVHRAIVIPEPLSEGRVVEELERLGLGRRNPAPLVERILLSSGVPAARIVVLPGPVDGTLAEARAIRRLFGGSPPARLAVVTSPSASRRACLLFGRVLPESTIVCAPTPYDAYDGRRWWAAPRQALAVVTEYQKLVVNLASLLLAGGE